MDHRSAIGMLEPAGYAAGDAASGEYRCTACGYGVTVQRTLPRCPMCGGASWKPRATSALRP